LGLAKEKKRKGGKKTLLGTLAHFIGIFEVMLLRASSNLS
jgi:hypothetical protein